MTLFVNHEMQIHSQPSIKDIYFRWNYINYQKMKFISLVFLPIFFILLSEVLAEEYIDYRLVPEDVPIHGRRVARTVNSKCSKPGPICNDCKNIHFCDSTLASSLLWTCAENETCENAKCVSTANPKCSSSTATFICNSEGVFPDPVDCFKYHYCIQTSTGTQGTKLTDYARSCSNDTTSYYSFNAKSTYCDKALTTEVCPATDFPVPVCKNPADAGALKENPSIYYICKMYLSTTPNSKIVLYPYQYICENGKTYNSTSYACM